MSPRRAAVVDVGTNSVLLTIARRPSEPADSSAARTGSALEPELELATITRLGEGVDQTHQLAAAAVERTLACLRDYGQRIRKAGVDRIALVGTSALRDVRGSAPFVARATELIGAPLEVISGTREAQLTFRGSLSGLDVSGPVVVFDIGGGSTELIIGSARPRAHHEVRGASVLDASHSYDLGSVRLTERHVHSDPPTAAELAAIRQDIRATLSAAPAAPGASTSRTVFEGATVVGVAGTVTTLAALEFGLDPYDAQRVHGATLSAAAVEGLIDRLAALPLSARQKLPGLEPRRADVIVAGGVLCSEMLRRLGAERLLVSDRGVRWGLVDELLSS